MDSYKQTQLKIQNIIQEIKSLCEQFTHKEYLEGFTDMRKLFILINQLKQHDFDNIKSNLDFLTICVNYDFADNEFRELMSFPFGSVEEALTDLNEKNPYTSKLGKTRFCVCWKKNHDKEEYYIFGTPYCDELKPNSIYNKTCKKIQTNTPDYSYEITCFVKK
jgi:hypothetical protein